MLVERSLETKVPTIWTDEKHSKARSRARKKHCTALQLPLQVQWHRNCNYNYNYTYAALPPTTFRSISKFALRSMIRSNQPPIVCYLWNFGHRLVRYILVIDDLGVPPFQETSISTVTGPVSIAIATLHKQRVCQAKWIKFSESHALPPTTFRSIGGLALPVIILSKNPLLFVSYLETYATALRGTTGTAYTLVDALSWSIFWIHSFPVLTCLISNTLQTIWLWAG